MSSGNSEHKLKACTFCGHDMPRTACFCSTCSKYQSWWRNWLPYLGGLAAALTIVGSGFLYVKTTWDAIKTEEKTRRFEISRQQSEVIISAFDSFHHGVSYLATGLREKLDFIARANLERQMIQAVEGEVLVGFGPGCQPTAEQQCILQTVSRDGSKKPVVLTAADFSPRLIRLIDSLQRYAQSLALLARGPEHCAVFLGTQLNVLTSIVAALGQTDIDVVHSEDPTCEFMPNEDQLARAERTLRNLSMALASAEPPIQQLPAYFEVTLDLQDLIFRMEALNRLDAAMQQFDEQRSREALEALQAALTPLQTSFTASTDNPVQDLAVAHGRLQALLAGVQVSSGETVISVDLSDFEQKTVNWCDQGRQAAGSNLGPCRPSD